MSLWRILTLGIAAAVMPLSACRTASGERQRTRSPLDARGDTVDAIAAVWRVAAPMHAGLRTTWLHVPTSDTGVVALSSDARAALVQQGVPASDRAPTGDDTVIYRIRKWESTPDGVWTLQLRSRWTTVRTAGPRPCRAGSGNVESYLVLRTAAGRWSAARSGPVIHGDNVCMPVR